MPETLPERVRFAGFELDLKTAELSGGGQTVRLAEKPFLVLWILVEHPEELVTREEIQKKLWPNDAVVDFEHGINTAIKVLRRALGDSGDEPKYIETIPRRGYRFMATVKWVRKTDNELSSDSGVVVGMPIVPAGLVGKKVSHYRVLAVIGGGGMGLVYQAEDVKLGRRVALKFLPEELANDPVVLQRFEREAQTASSLNHSNICTIYEIEEYQGQPFIVMELLEGETLRSRLATATAAAKPLSVDELLDIGLQICDGLGAAHRNGIIHRDIKPANIFRTNNGVCKILDFGLAKLLQGSEEEEAATRPDAPGHSRPAASVSLTLSRTGVAMGTAGYMSPEQVRGEKLDARTDLFSFGLVLYEMATGQRAFSGETPALVDEAILKNSPIPMRELNSTLPAKLVTTIDKALEKDREQRHQSAAELRIELEGFKSGLDSVRTDSSRGRRRRWSLWLAASLVTLLAGLAIVGLLWRRMGPSKELTERQLTANPLDDNVGGAAISPDSKYVAYQDQTGLYLRSIDSGETRPIAVPAELSNRIYHLCWFPGGDKLLADVEGSNDEFDIWVITMVGGAEPHLLYRHGVATGVSPDGRMIGFHNWGACPAMEGSVGRRD